MKPKRPTQSLYVPPAFRYKLKNECEENKANVRNQFASEDTNRQIHCFGKHESSQRRSRDIVRRQVPFQSSSSSYDPKNTSDESSKNEDSSDFEESGSDIASVNDFKTSKETIENYSNCHWKKEVSRGSPSKTNQNENDESNTKLFKKQLMQNEQYPGVTFSSDQGMNLVLNKKNHFRHLFYDSADRDISDIENTFDNFTIKENLSTSPPTSDIVDEKVLDAVKCIPEEDIATESILLFQNDSQIANNTNKKDCNYNFESYHDDSSVKKLEDFSEIFGNNYIAPPVPAQPYALPLPPIHRLPYSVPSSSVSSRNDFPHNVSHYINQLSHPRILLPPSLQIYPDFPHGLHYRPPICQETISSLPFLNSPRSLQERMISPLSSQGIFDAPNLASHKQDIIFYIPPPLPTQQMMNTNNPNQRYDLQSYLLSTKAMMNKAMHDSKMFP